ncbi:MAG: serine hydrolase [Planctomycetota bacterium]
MLHLRTLARPLAALVLLLTSFLSAAPAARADPQTDVVTPTAWLWRANVSLTTLNADIANGYRIVDLEVEDDSPLRFSAVLVRNTGDYAKGWWWYYGQTSSQVTSRLSQHNARLIDVEPYQTPSGTRYAIVLIPNGGSDFALQHGWRTGNTFQGVVNWLNANPTRRITDIQQYVSAGNLRYAFVWVQNTGQLQSPFWVYMNATGAQISSALSSNNARLIDLESHDSTGRFSAVMVPNDGNAWWWLTNISGGDVDRLANQFASRMIDLERYVSTSGSIRYSMVLRRNENDLTVTANGQMRNFLPLGATSGLVLREYNGATSTMAGNFEDRSFEPASLMKTVHHFVASREVALGNKSWNSVVIERPGLNGSCPTGTGISVRTLRDVCRDMMESSSNTATEAVREYFGTSFILSRAAIFGATGVALNHTLGCLCGMQRNELTLMDLADLHEAVVAGALGNERDDFYELMSNGTNFGMGSYSTADALDDELNASSLSAVERDSFRAGVRLAHKGGSYTCVFGLNREVHRSRGAYVRLPFRAGCGTVPREYFIGAWVNDADTSSQGNDAVGVGVYTLFRDRVRAAIDSWEAASCSPFVSYCSANANSTGQIGLAAASGSNYILSNDLVLRALQLPNDTFGFLLVSTQEGFAANPGGSAGNLCLGGGIGRYQNAIQSTGTTGQLSLSIDLGAIPRPSGPDFAVEPGETLRFQWWHRDSSSAGSPTSNFTNGLRVTFI